MSVVAVLTLRKHAEGVWITSLVDKLRKRCGARTDVRIEVLILEELELDRFALDSAPPWAAVVNRVSDAASPELVKVCLAVLNACVIWDVPCFNGPRSYAIGCNKALHHHAFARAGLRSPQSVVLRAAGCSPEELRRKLVSASRTLEERGCRWPLLLKPNSAGFGAGIRLFNDMKEFENVCDICSDDGVVILQEYIPPLDGRIYRIWFLEGTLQCAVTRWISAGQGIGPVPESSTSEFTAGCVGKTCSLSTNKKAQDKNNSQDNLITDEFSGGCVGGVCTRAQPNGREEMQSNGKLRTRKLFAPWAITDDIRMDVHQILAVVGEDCHAGSIEFLFGENGQKVYFDLNMLSTLPLLDNGTVDTSLGIWPEGYDPWAEIADAVLRVAAR